MSSTFIIVKQLSQYLTSMREMILNTQKVMYAGDWFKVAE